MNDGYCYSLAYSTAHPSGTPETPDTSHFDETFLTNVPSPATPDSQLNVRQYVVTEDQRSPSFGKSKNKAFI